MDKEASTSSGSLQTGCNLGDDEEGKLFLEELRKSGLATGPIPTTPEGRAAAIRVYFSLLSAYRTVFPVRPASPLPDLTEPSPPALTRAPALDTLSPTQLLAELRRLRSSV